ncbi:MULTISPECIES: ABC transporter ATP-binding protein [Limnobacter]|uniref:Lipoprotein-releasing system ATP-binding protein LolD n=1 Tax=Limnobacter litoralis TaxID=481366 RepID=A0ABQ5YKI8_9BURK|nr:MULTISPECIES: ATP-binding cassette domain-containing protein [Limnobacter]GLR25053.1 lipoprotein-releasing system ATP-binding protein LolD [Limnobacter litoralis]HEX5484527.1 ATP-binding cassette domain-containing protein [Limnobacter sp.]
MSKVVIETRKLSKAFKGITAADQATRVIHELDFKVMEGETVAIVGASGAGKSTLLHVLGGLESPDSGQVLWGTEAIDQWSVRELGFQRNKTLGFIYQFHHLLPEFSALDNVAMALRIGGTDKKQARQRAAVVLERLNLGHRLNHRPAELSGGERQRVAIARALVTQPKAILADEPTGNLDLETANQVFASLIDNNREAKAALVMVTHSLELAHRCERVLSLSKGQLTVVK